MAIAEALGFHLYLDQKVRPYWAYIPRKQEWTTTVVQKHTVIQDRTLSYLFQPHFHPYVGSLVSRLLQHSVGGLQAADTEYRTNEDGTLQAIDGTPRAVLQDGVQQALTDGAVVTLAADTPVELQEGTAITCPDGSADVLRNLTRAALVTQLQVAVSATKVSTFRGGLPITIPSGTQTTLRDGTVVTLAAKSPATLPDRTSATLAAVGQVRLMGGAAKPELYDGIFSPARYAPTGMVQTPYPVKDLDFSTGGAYSVYNWELFYHVPLTLAIQLSKNQRHEEAQRWFHYIFDPTDDSQGPTPERFWKVKPFQLANVKRIEEVLVNLSTGDDLALQSETKDSIAKWKESPFRPHAVARHRQSAFMFKAVMAYLDNVISWGDSLFRQDTRETINEATQMYVLSANILGPRPQPVPKKGTLTPRTYAQLQPVLDRFSNALLDLEADVPFDISPHPTETSDFGSFNAAGNLGKALYFCVPRNDKLLSYWDTVADRLFKIRNSLNLQGIFRQLPLWAPPIDPGLLAKAAAAGLDIGAIVSGASLPLPLVRFQFLIQKAIEMAQEVKSLGGSLLSAMEKEDNEAMSILRARHEREILALSEMVKYSQWQEAIKTMEGLEVSLKNAVQRYVHYERLLGESEGDIGKRAPDSIEDADKAGLQNLKFKAKEPTVADRRIDIDIAQDSGGLSGGRKLSSHELEELDQLSSAQSLQTAASVVDTIGSVLAMLPQFRTEVKPFGVGGSLEWGGSTLHNVMSATSSVLRALSAKDSYDANMAAKAGSYSRREQEWEYQSNLAAGEITQVYKQLRAAQIREAIAKREWDNHKKQIRNAEEIERFLRDDRTGKKANKDLYAWMRREVKGLYGQCFEFAFDLARKAERALQIELGQSSESFVQYTYREGKEGFLAGEKLHLDLKRMEMAYHDLNVREIELTKSISLLQLDPVALLGLRTAGKCEFEVPESLFDLDCPGQYFRRIRSVALSIPCLTGPYASVNCRLTQVSSTIRKDSTGDDYPRQGTEDPRFEDYHSSLQSIVTSSAQNDGGLFEVSLRDERRLPFELTGAVSRWRLELTSPEELRSFDPQTISDVVLHLRMTAREGGEMLRDSAVAHLDDLISEAQAAGTVRLFSVRNEFPTEWKKLTSAKIAGNVKTAPLELQFKKEHYPFWCQNRIKSVLKIELFAQTSGGSVKIAEKSDGSGERTLSKGLGKLLVATLAENNVLPESPVGPWALYFTEGNSKLRDVWLAMTWISED
jgi:hypothetical protein